MALRTLAAGLVLLASPALAAEPNLSDVLSLGHACGNDVKNLCSGVERGSGAIVHCIVAHADSLSPACAEALDALKAKAGKP